MAMRPRGGAQVPRSQYVVHPIYEYFEPKFDEKEEPTAYVLHVYLPGFAREQFKVMYDESAKKIKARGERPLGNYRWSYFEQEFSIPDHCIGSQIRGKFERNVLMITMPKKVIVTQLPPQESEAKKATQEPTSPQLPSEPKKLEETKVDKPAGPPSPKKATTEPKPQKGKQESPQKQTSTADLGHKEREKKTAEPASPLKVTSLMKATAEPKPQKGEQERDERTVEPASPPKITSPRKATAEQKPQKGKQDSPQKPTSDADLSEKQRDMDSPKVTSLKNPQKVEDQSPPYQKPTPNEKEKESSKKSKEAAIAESGAQDQSRREMEKTDGYSRTGDQEKPEMSGTKKPNEGQDVAAYAKEVMGKLAKRLKEDEDSKQSLMNAGVSALLIVALGTYIAYTIGLGDANN